MNNIIKTGQYIEKLVKCETCNFHGIMYLLNIDPSIFSTTGIIFFHDKGRQFHRCTTKKNLI